MNVIEGVRAVEEDLKSSAIPKEQIISVNKDHYFSENLHK
jgi:hypothetical protein